MTHICVFAGSSDGQHPDYMDAARNLGRLLAGRGITLVYGGACVGLMGALADAALASGGRVIGVIPHALVTKEVAHDSLSELHVVSSMHERKAMMAELSDAFVALPGGLGTWEELFEVLTWGQLGLHAKACGLLNVRGYFDDLLAFGRHAVEEGFVRHVHLDMLAVADDADALLARLDSYQPPVVPKWIGRRET